jgi:hypothetical protein
MIAVISFYLVFVVDLSMKAFISATNHSFTSYLRSKATYVIEKRKQQIGLSTFGQILSKKNLNLYITSSHL